MARQECDYLEETITQVIDTAYSSSANINDGIYFKNNVCQIEGWYQIFATVEGSGANAQPAYIDLNVEGKTSRGVGWQGKFNGMTFASNLVKKNVGNTISITVTAGNHSSVSLQVRIVKVG